MQDLNGKPSNQPDRHPSELIVLNKLIEVYAEKLERYDQMLSEYRVVLNPDYIIDIISVMLLQVIENVQLDPSLMMKALLVADNLHCNELIGLVVIALNSLSERALPQEFLDLISIADVVVKDNLVVPAIIIIPIVMLKGGSPLDLGCIKAEEVDLFVILDLCSLIVGQVVLEKLEGLSRSDRVLEVIHLN